MRVEYGNFLYFIIIIVAGALTGFLVWLSRKKGPTFAKNLVWIFVWSNFALHFAKQLLPFYLARWPWGLTDSLFPNLCATLIFAAPFILLSKNKYLMDYFCLIGLISGVSVYFIPTGATRTDVEGFDYVFETVRFYICHFPLILCPLILMICDLHHVSVKRLWMIPLVFIGVLLLVATQQIVFGPVLKVESFPHDWFGEDGVFNPLNIHAVVSNQSMQFGPQPGVKAAIGDLYKYYFPYVLTYQFNGQIYFVPALWFLPILYVATYIAGPGLCFLFEPSATKNDFISLRNKLKRKKKAEESDTL